MLAEFEAGTDTFGEVVLVDLEDVTGDGIPELLVARPELTVAGVAEAGSVELLSGADYSLLHEWHGTADEELFGLAVITVEDADGDGLRDILIGAPSAPVGGQPEVGRVDLYSSASPFNLIRSWNGGAAEAGYGHTLLDLGDVTGDGLTEFVASAPEWYSSSSFLEAGRIWVHQLHVAQGAGSLVYEAFGDQYPGTFNIESFGAALETLGDVNGDGFPDLAVGAPGPVPVTVFVYNSGHLFILDGTNGDLIYDLDEGENGDAFGFSLARVQDVDGDNVDDILVGSPLAGGVPEAYDAGEAELYSGRTGDELGWYVGEGNFDWFGHSVDAADLDGDGVDDYLMGAPVHDAATETNRGAFYVHNGASSGFDPLYRQRGEMAHDYLGIGMRFGADRNQDGVPEIYGWALGFGNAKQARAFIYSGKVVPQMTASGSQISNSAGGAIRFFVDFPDEASLYWYQLLYSGAGTGPVNMQGLSVPLGYDRFLVDSYLGDYSPAFKNPSGLLKTNGDAQVDLSVPSGGVPPSLIGRTLHFACISRVVWGDWEYSSVAVPVEFVN